MNNSAFRPVYYGDGMSEVHKLMIELEQAGHILEVENVVLTTMLTVVVKFAGGRVTRIVYKRSFLDLKLGRTF